MTTIFADDFNRANSTNLGANWTESVGDVRIQSNRIDNVLTTECLALCNTTISPTDYNVIADLLIVSGSNNAGVIGRYSDNNNYYYARVATTANALSLFTKTLGGGLVSIGSFSVTITAGVTYNVKLEMIGTTINVYLNGTQRISVTDVTHATGAQAGIRINNGDANTGTVDNFTINDVGTSPSISVSASPSVSVSLSPSLSPSSSVSLSPSSSISRSPSSSQSPSSSVSLSPSLSPSVSVSLSPSLSPSVSVSLSPSASASPSSSVSPSPSTSVSLSPSLSPSSSVSLSPSRSPSLSPSSSPSPSAAIGVGGTSMLLGV